MMEGEARKDYDELERKSRTRRRERGSIGRGGGGGGSLRSRADSAFQWVEEGVSAVGPRRRPGKELPLHHFKVEVETRGRWAGEPISMATFLSRLKVETAQNSWNSSLVAIEINLGAKWWTNIARSLKSGTAGTMVGGPIGCYCIFEDLDLPGNENWGDLNTLLVPQKS